MLRFQISFLISLFCLASIHSQNCPPNDVILHSQDQVNAFRQDFPNCTEIKGNLEVSGEDIVHLDSLLRLERIGGVLLIHNNENLINLKGLRNVKAIGTNGVMGSLTILNNTALKTLNGLQGITAIPDLLTISNNLDLENINGLNVASVGKTFYLQANPNLSDLSGLANLQTIGKDFYLEKNPKFTSLYGLGNLESIAGSFYIQFNPILNDISGLHPNLNVGNKIALSLNDALSNCAVDALCSIFKGSPEKVLQCGNAAGCGSIQEVLDACTPVSTITENVDLGLEIYPNPSQTTVFVDKNESGTAYFELINPMGEVLRSGVLKSPIDIRFLPSGIYFLKVKIGLKTSIRRVVKS